MAEKRKTTRMRKRLKLRYGVRDATSLAFTENFSDTGIFIRTTNVMMPGTALLVEIELPDATSVICEVKVMWGKRVPGTLSHLQKGGMGVMVTKFLAGEQAYRELCRGVAANNPRAEKA
ncbi:MAG: PilZ domain-containing protein [Deltaproteobacteria bacterium]|nr:PilZ domain-containing protein [Deltaproteobacteria bacterium]